MSSEPTAYMTTGDGWQKMEVVSNSTTISEPRELYVRCDCGHFEHMAVLSYWPAGGEEDRVVYLSINLADNDRFFRRVVMAIKYIFGWRSRYGHYTELVLGDKQVAEIVLFFQEYCESLPGMRPGQHIW